MNKFIYILLLICFNTYAKKTFFCEDINMYFVKNITIPKQIGFEKLVQQDSIQMMPQNNFFDKNQRGRITKSEKLINILAIFLITILSFLSWTLYKNNRTRIQTNLLLEEKNKELLLSKEKAEKASKARSEFLSTVSHELRTPLNAINGITHLLLEENPKESQLEYLNSLKISGNYLMTFINEILETSRIESLNITTEKINFNLLELVNNIYNSLHKIAVQNHNVFKLDIDNRIPMNLIGDSTKLSQIFINLINNSIKFTQNGEIVLSAKLHRLDNGLASISFQVKDTGIGIAEEQLDAVFESFSQGSVEINRKYGGTGLGLTIVKNLIQILGGTIRLESQIGHGACFTFNLDFMVNQSQIEAPKQVFDHSNLNCKRVLLVEDNKINQMITKKMIESKKVLCTIVDNGEDAITEVQNNHYDMVLMDIHLPGINGTIATKKIREFNQKIPVIALTAISLNENKEMLLSYGLNDVVTKPFAPDDLYNTMLQYLS